MVNTYITTFQLYFGMVLAGLFTGLGSALGNYFANKTFIKQLDKIKIPVKEYEKPK
jgi:hypothetical protein